ncbi:MAG TPA: ABC transporter ATP-binding protein [Candidatus Binatia bacterium]|jgi:iron complex transport system ATP-binding protein
MSGGLRFARVAFRHDGAVPGRGGILEDIDLVVQPGRTLAIVGPNGSGKTTLLRLAAGELVAERGTIEICGLDPARAPRRELARRVAVVAAHAPVGFGYTVEEIVLMGRAPWVEGYRLESAEDLRVAHEAMDALDVTHLAGRVFDSLSSGERQRASVARALAQQPELVLLDEPAAFLDIKHQVELYDVLLSRSRTTGMTVVSVLHDLNLAALYFDEVAMIGGGRIFVQGAPDDVITYANVRAVFDTDVYVDRNHLTGHLNVLPLPRGLVAREASSDASPAAPARKESTP